MPLASGSSDGTGELGGAGDCWAGAGATPLLNVEGKLPSDPVKLTNDSGG